MPSHKTIRGLLALLVVGSAAGFLYPVNASADDPKCDCWYPSSNKYGVITKVTVNGKEVEKCDTEAKCAELIYD